MVNRNIPAFVRLRWSRSAWISAGMAGPSSHSDPPPRPSACAGPRGTRGAAPASTSRAPANHHITRRFMDLPSGSGGDGPAGYDRLDGALLALVDDDVPVGLDPLQHL